MSGREIYKFLQALRRIAFLLVGMSLCWSSQAALAGNSTNREITRTYAHYFLQKKQYKRLQQTLQRHLKRDQNDAAAWNFLGLSYMDTQSTQQATFAFYKAATETSDPELKGVYLYHYADALIQTGDRDRAADVLKRAQKYEVVASAAKKALQNLRPHEPLPELRGEAENSVRLNLSAAGGYDTNVLLYSDATTATTSATSTSSPFFSGFVDFGLAEEFQESEFTGGLIGAYTYYTQEDVQQFNSIFSQLDLDYSTVPTGNHGFAWGIGNRFLITFLNPDGYTLFNAVDTPRFVLAYHHSATQISELQLQGGYQHYRTTSSDDPDDDRTGPIVTPYLNHQLYFGVNSINATLGYEGVFASGKNYVSHGSRMRLQFARPILGFTTAMGLESGIFFYPDAEEERRDILVSPSIGLGRRFFQKVQASLQYSFRRNWSKLESAQYKKHLVSLILTFEVFR